MFRIVNDKAEAERIVRDGGGVRFGETLELCLSGVAALDNSMRPVNSGNAWDSWSGPYVVVREPPPKPLTNEEIVAELERRARDCSEQSGHSAFYDGMEQANRLAAKLVRERKLR